ncbi:MAG: hypothetical protein RLZZ399_2392 [Verrucomicrobiota bacterium]|jgi:curved DNA-binding protein
MAVHYKDYYQVLGVSKNASQDEIRKAFRKLAREYHPDVAKDKKGAEAKFKEINEANEVLGDPQKRKKYDELGMEWERGGFQAPPEGHWSSGNGFGGEGFSDFFEAFFGGGARSGGGGFGRGPSGRMPKGPFGPVRHEPQDLEAEVHVSVEEALEGAKKRVSFRKAAHSLPETLEVRIPKGVCEGQKVRLAGKGSHGGDLLLKVSIAPHPRYQVEGSDLVSDVAVSAWKAVLGSEVEVATPDGSVRMKIPAGTQPGRRFRLRGRGLPKRNKERGDFYAQIRVVLPVECSAEEQARWEALADLERSGE